MALHIFIASSFWIKKLNIIYITSITLCASNATDIGISV